jgi:membrane-bound lytic murein transglycosylase D
MPLLSFRTLNNDRSIMKKNFAVVSIFLALLLAQPAFSQDEDSLIFAVPPSLKDNVEFWKKIYTDVGLHEGLFHDRDYPKVIYKRIHLEQTSGWGYSRTVEGQKKHIAECLKHVETQPESTWNEEEKTYAALYKEQASDGAIAGASSRVRFQLGQKERFRKGVEISTAYLDTIRSIFKAHNVPSRLAYLPHVESSFNYESYSKVGAAGVWQFMRSTGRLFLKINYLIDERRDPILSTTAAARLLKSNYQALGAWPLAITAYNHGVNGMRRAVDVTGSRDIEVIIKNYCSPSFQFSSKNFYACFLAASEVAMDASNHFDDLRCTPKMSFKNVKLPSYMRPSVVCNYLKIAPEVLREFNPSIRPVVFSQGKQLPAQYEIRVPLDVVSGSMDKLLASVPDSLKSNEPEHSGYYTVQLGDNLASIASRFGVSITQLAMENNISRKNRIFEGQVLRMPQNKAGAPASVQTAMAEATQIPEAPVVEEKPIEAAPTPKTTLRPKPMPSPTPAQALMQQASKAAQPSIAPSAIDTMTPPKVTPWPIIQRDAGKGPQLVDASKMPEHLATPLSPKETKLTMKALAEAPVTRKISTSAARKQAAVFDTKTAQAGAALSDSLKEIAMTTAVPSVQPAPSVKPSVFPKFDVDVYNLETTLSADGSTAEIRVSTDETIGHYADWLGIPTYRIRQLNRMGGRSDIRINSPILIPAEQPAFAKMMQTRLEYHMAIEEDFYGRYKVADVKRRTLRRGEALWDICNGPDQIPLWLLKKYNKQLDIGKLLPGVALWIPNVEEKSEQEIREESNVNSGIYPIYQAPSEMPKTRFIYRMP